MLAPALRLTGAALLAAALTVSACKKKDDAGDNAGATGAASPAAAGDAGSAPAAGAAPSAPAAGSPSASAPADGAQPAGAPAAPTGDGGAVAAAPVDPASPPVQPQVQGPDPTQDPNAGSKADEPQQPVALPPTVDGGVAAPELPDAAGAAPANVAQATAVVDHLTQARFRIAPGAPVNPGLFGATSCVGKRIDGIDAAVCQYADEKAAQNGAKMGKAWIKGALSGTVVQRGATTLALADRAKIDPNGKTIQKIAVEYAKIQ